MTGHHSADSIYLPEVMSAAQKQLVEDQSGPLTSVSSTQGFFPCKKFFEDGELEEVIKLIEDTPADTPFQKKQRELIIRHIKDDKSANMQLVFVAATADFEKGVYDQSKLFLPPSNLNAPNRVTLAIGVQYPVSRGYIHIKSSDPHQQPEINPNYLAHPADVIMMAAGYKFAEKLANSQHVKGKFGRRCLPSEDRDLSTAEGRRKVAGEFVLGEYHSCGSCAMGSTVDSKLRVKGVEKLRVADASVFANHVSGNIVSSVYMIAEKAADMIKQDWDYAALKSSV
eukprot:TRINITY_DN408_c0_g1_i4.p1 TRINITY_DN408_c0_g1~~TRINITY_DN408_c0_g1_i4.p1  ORF type:complete len:283 (-),score=67.92 TRINITY_DN408_c0_g1_i4:19-867(-)